MLPLSEDGYRLAVAVLIVNGIQRAARMHRAEDDVIGQFGDILVAAESAGAAQPVTQAEENPCKSPKKNAAQSIYAPICSQKHQKNILQGNRIKKTRKINDLGITRVLACVYI